MAETTITGLTVDPVAASDLPRDERPVTNEERMLHQAILHLRRGHHKAAAAQLVDAINTIGLVHDINVTARIA